MEGHMKMISPHNNGHVKLMFSSRRCRLCNWILKVYSRQWSLRAELHGFKLLASCVGAPLLEELQHHVSEAGGVGYPLEQPTLLIQWCHLVVVMVDNEDQLYTQSFTLTQQCATRKFGRDKFSLISPPISFRSLKFQYSMAVLIYIFLQT